MKKTIIAIIIISIFGIMAVGFYDKGFLNLPSEVLKTPDTIDQLGLPEELIIENININAKVVYLGLDDSGAVKAPEGPNDVAWFSLGPKPGEKGSAIISGHYGKWKNGAQSVFNNLSNLKQGDIIKVKNNTGEIMSFVVEKTETYAPDDVIDEVFNKNDNAYLNLITCNGEWIESKKTYAKRLVVFTKLQDI